MLEANYKRDLNHNYLILKCNSQIKAEGYELKMLLNNKIEGFLGVSTRYVDGVANLYYEISSKQSMKRVFENREIGYELLREFLFHFQQILVKAEEFLVDTKHLIIQPEFLYMNVESNEIALVFHPDYEQDVKEAFQEMAEYFLNKIDHQDNKAVMLAYQLYKNTRNNNFTIKEMLSLLQEGTDTEIEKNIKGKIGREANTEKVCEIKIEKKYNTEIKDVWENEEFSTQDFLHQNEILHSSLEDKLIQNTKRNNSSFDSMKIDRKDSQKNIEENETENKTEGILFKVEAFLIFILIAMAAIKITNLVEMTYQEFVLGFGIIIMIMTMIGVKIYLNRKRNYIRKEDHHFENVMNEGKEYEFQDRSDERPVIPENKTKDQEMQIIDFLSEPTAPRMKEEVYGNTVLLGSTMNIEQRKLTGKLHGKEIECYMEHFPFTVGKLGSHVDLELKDSSISRMHARIIEREGCLYLEDLNSTNGSYKNGMPLEANETVKIESGDEICFAKICLTYH